MVIIIRNILYIAFFFCLAISQDYLWPVKAKKELTAVFGEERPGRYHTGIDVRTFGEIGYHLIAIDDGYISEIGKKPLSFDISVTISLLSTQVVSEKQTIITFVVKRDFILYCIYLYTLKTM